MKLALLQPSLAFSGVYLGEDVGIVKRKSAAVKDIETLQSMCRQTNDEARWVISLLSDTGLRLSEALGLAKDDVNMTATTPYIDIRPRPRRRLKTRSSKWLSSKLQGADHIVLHSFRHSLRDRLRAVKCPPDIIDSISGWSKAGVGEGYGDGRKIEIFHKWMSRIVA